MKIAGFAAAGEIYGIAVDSDYLFLATTDDGFRVLDFSTAAKLHEVGHVFTQGWPRDIEVTDSLLYIASYYSHLEVIDIKGPVNPKKIGYCQIGGYGRGVAVRSNIAYLADWFDGIYMIRFDPTGPSAVRSNSVEIPVDVALHQNYPNPFNPETQITYLLPQTGRVMLKIYNIQGQLIKTVVDEFQPEGTTTVVWDGRCTRKKAASVIYLYQFQVYNYIKSKKMVLIE